MERALLKECEVVKSPILNPSEIMECIKTAQMLCQSICDRPDLHERGLLERFHDVLMGEAAERSVIKWLQSRGAQAKSAVAKTSGRPDLGHDILLKRKQGDSLRCSVKSSISAYYADINTILDTFSIATKKTEICDVNIQVYYWLNLKEKPRVAVPSEYNMAIVGWLGRNDFSGKAFVQYVTEEREVADIKLRQIRAMDTLLEYLE